MSWTGAGTGIISDPWQITTAAEFVNALNLNTSTTYMKVMNDVDMISQVNYYRSLTFDLKGHLDGNNKTITSLVTGNGFGSGLTFWNGLSLINIKFQYTSGVTSGASTVVYQNANNLTSITLQNVHIVAIGSSLISYFIYVGPIIGASSVISNITMEGNIRSIFKCDIHCNVSNVNLYRLAPAISGEQNLPFLFSTVFGTIDKCQIIVPSFSPSGGSIDMSSGMIVQTLQTSTILQQCLVLANINVTQSNINTTNTLHILYGAQNGGAGPIVQDCLVLGNFYINGGNNTLPGGTTVGKSGFINGASITTIHRRNIFNGDLSNSDYNNRPIFSKLGISGYDQSHQFYNKDAVVSMTPIDEVGNQIGFTAAQMVVQSNFTGFDFGSTWSMGASNPVLQNNPIYTYDIPLVSVNITSIVRNSSSSFSVTVTEFAADSFGIDVLDGATIVFNSTNQLTSIFTGITQDHSYSIAPYYYSGGIKHYSGSSTPYFHYFEDAAYADPVVINEDAKVTFTIPFYAELVHGTEFYDGYWYGGTRGNPFPTNPGLLIRTPQENITAYQEYPIYVSNPVVGTLPSNASTNLEQVVVCKGKIYATFYNQSVNSNDWVLEFDPIVNDYKVYQVGKVNSIAPIITDGEFLYFESFTTIRKIYKVDPATAFISSTKYNPSTTLSLSDIAIAVYDEDSQGGYISGGYNAAYKGTVHSAITDSNYLYVAFDTPYNGFISGYDPATGRTYNEIHKIRKSDMTPAGWVYSPQGTDDMCQNSTHIFLGVEIQASANPTTYGYGWGSVAFRKSDLHLTAIPRLHKNDNPPTGNQSYGGLMFGQYLVDLRTNRQMIFINVSDADNWSITENIGQRTVGTFINKYLGVQDGVPLNEVARDTLGNVYGTYWSSQASLSQFTISGIDIYSNPTIENFISTVDILTQNVTLSTYLLDNGGLDVSSQGFIYGTSPTSLNNTISGSATNPFTATIIGLSEGTYYWKAYATNSHGTTYGSLESFSIISTSKIYFNNQKINFVYLGIIPLTYKP